MALVCLSPRTAKAESVDCGNDPIYTRDFNAKTTMGARVRSIPCMTGSEILTVLPGGTVVPVIAETDGWYKVKAGDKTGWVGSQLMAKTDQIAQQASEDTAPEIQPTYKATGLVGISEPNFNRLKAGNRWMVNRMKNKIALRVHARGQAYFVKPNGGLIYLKNAQEVKKFMHPEEQENKISTPDKTEAAAKPVISTNGSITLTGILSDPGKVKLTWNIDGVDAPLGFKVVISEQANPVYPGNDYHYLSDPAVRQDIWSGLGAKTYHFRVCQYLGGSCGVYSNDLAIQVATNGAASGVSTSGSISLTVTTVNEGKADLSWKLSDMTSPKGFKVVRSEQVNPVYPGNDYHYLTDPNQISDTWTGLTPGTLYHFRVCEYLGGYCGIYSNDVAVTAK
jgi:hypothetical protein